MKQRQKEKRETIMDEIYQASRAASAATVMFHQTIAERMGLNATEHKCADILHRSGPVTAGQLAELTGLTTGAITGIVDRLEEAGYARRVKDPEDRRRVIIEPRVTAEQQRYLHTLFEPLIEGMGMIASGYSENDLELILDFTRRSTEVVHEATLKIRGKGKRRRGEGKRGSVSGGSGRRGKDKG